MNLESPDQLLRRLALGREEYCQRLLTMLIVGGPYPKWNSRNPVSPRGRRFLEALDARSFGAAAGWAEPCEFVDELDLPRRHDAEKGGAPDWAVLWPARTWIIELKTERGSHRQAQIPSYFRLGRHHFPDCAIDVTYLTPPFETRVDLPEDWARYAHVAWDEVLPLVRDAWADDDTPGVAPIVEALDDTFSRLAETPTQWRARLSAPPPATTPDPVEEALDLARATADDGRQRALDHESASLDALLDLRLAVRARICAEPTGSALRHVMAWIWQPQSTGSPLTDAGGRTGYELRLSRYTTPVC